MEVNTIINLKVITCLQPFQRLNTREPLFRIKQYKYIPEWLHRWWDGSSRESDFGRINDLYTYAIAHQTKPNMVMHLKNSVKGLQSLKKTYENCTTTVARIETMIEQIGHEVDTEVDTEVDV